jgi:hypothetical protein
MRIRYAKIDQAEADYAIRLFNNYVAIGNEREEQGLPGEIGDLPAGHIYHPSFRRRLFRDYQTGRRSEITLRKEQNFFKGSPRPGCFQPLDPENIRKVRRVMTIWRN